MRRSHQWENEDLTREETYLLVGVQDPRMSLQEADTSMAELQELTRSAGASAADSLIIKVRSIDARTYIGKGRVDELARRAASLGVHGVIFDADFSPVQQRNLEDAFEVRVIGRTELILAIFARRAQTHEGKLQVELAQLQYLRPRLIGSGFVLSRQGGGIGSRGPGESRLEMDRRRIADRIGHLRRELTHVRRTRETQRKRRERQEVPTLALVGYTNAGKSTLLRALTNADVLVEDKLFATLDPTARRLLLPDGKVAVLSDTVGFINRLPTTLVEAFKATLEQVTQADLLLHVIDASSPTVEREIATTEQVLEDIGADERPRIRVFNKIDQAMDRSVLDIISGKAREDAVAISALYGIGLHDLLSQVVQALHVPHQRLKLALPYSRFDLLSRLYSSAKVHHIEYEEDAVHLTVEVDEQLTAELQPFLEGSDLSQHDEPPKRNRTGRHNMAQLRKP